MAAKAQQNSDALNEQLMQLEAIRKNANKVLSKINAQHEKARAKGTQLSEKQMDKLRGLYEQAYTLSQDERQVAIAASNHVTDMINSAKRKSEGGGGGGKKRRSNIVQQHPISPGAMVAANHDQQWILGRVQEFDFSSETVRCAQSRRFASFHACCVRPAARPPAAAHTRLAHCPASSIISRTPTSPSSR
jgi:hypothetical protein